MLLLELVRSQVVQAGVLAAENGLSLSKRLVAAFTILG